MDSPLYRLSPLFPAIVGTMAGFIIMPMFKTKETAEHYATKSCFHPEITEVQTKHETKYIVKDLFDNQN